MSFKQYLMYVCCFQLFVLATTMAEQCPKCQYYDKDFNECSDCGYICNPEKDRCHRQCPDWLDCKSTTPLGPTPPQTPPQTPPGGPSEMWLWLVLILLVISAVVIVIIIAKQRCRCPNRLPIFLHSKHEGPITTVHVESPNYTGHAVQPQKDPSKCPHDAGHCLVTSLDNQNTGTRDML